MIEDSRIIVCVEEDGIKVEKKFGNLEIGKYIM
jgi:hypothetical protein